MTDFQFLKRLFQAYYQEKREDIPDVSLFEHREFGFIPWDKPIMIRHMGFRTNRNLTDFLIEKVPRHAYSSGSLYILPDIPEMEKKEYQGCDLIIDIDVDHFYTPCKEDHDFWYCKECGNSGKGMIDECPNCKKKKISTLTWICKDCLKISKNEIKKLIYDFLIPDFGIDENDFKIAFSGHRGYHLKVENPTIRKLSSDERREIADYITGDSISFEVLGLREITNSIYGLIKDNIGWSKKILNKMVETITTLNNSELKQLLIGYGLNEKVSQSFINSKEEFRKTITSDNNLWAIEGFGMVNWKTLLKGIVGEVGIEIDEPVTIDIHRLIRYPGSLHGKTGFKVQELTLEEFEGFNPLDEPNEKLDPIVFLSTHMQKLEITAENVPITKIKGESFGPYKKGEIIEVPNHIAVLLLSKEVAKTMMS